MEIQTPFRANYEIENPLELPSSGVGVLYFPPAHPAEGRVYEERLRLTYLGQRPWYGVFAARSKRQLGLCLASTMPNPDWCCVASVGTGYLLNVARPEEWHPATVEPVLRVTVVSERQLLLLNSFDRIVAYGEEGQRWRTESLCSDQLQVVAVRRDVIECTGWDAPNGEGISLCVDLLSGKRKR
jgi:hypothetical protein